MPISSEKLAELYVEIIAKSDKLEAELNQLKAKSNRTVGNIQNSFKNLFLYIGGAAALRGIFQFIKYTKNLARDAEEIRSKFVQVFSGVGEGANEVAKSFAKDFGLAISTSKNLLAETGDLLVGFGFTDQKALELSVSVNRLAQDLVSFKNFQGGAKGASDALTKALFGETEAAKSLGIVIRQDSKEFKLAVQNRAIEKGLTESQAKALVILDEAYRQTQKAVGDYGRTKESLANTERAFAEEIKALNEEMGTQSVTVISTMIKYLRDLGKTLGDGDSQVGIFGIALKSLATIIIPLIGIVKMLGTYIGTFWAAIATGVTAGPIEAFKVLKKGFSLIQEDAQNTIDNVWNMWDTAGRKQKDAWDPKSLDILKGKIEQTKSIMSHMEEHGFKGNNIYEKYKKNLEELQAQLDSVTPPDPNATYDPTTKKLGQIKAEIEKTTKLLDTMAPSDAGFDKTKAKLKQLKDYVEGITKDVEPFQSLIPPNYTADQVAEFESLKFEIKGYVDFRKAQIELEYDNERKSAKGNSEELKRIEEQKLLNYAKLAQEQADIQKIASDATNKILKDGTDEAERIISDGIDADSDALSEGYVRMEDALREYYDQARTLDEDYFKWKIGAIVKHSMEMQEAIGGEEGALIAKQYEIDELKALEQEYFDWRLKAWEEQAGLVGDITEAGLAGISAGYDRLWQSITDLDMTGSERSQAIWESIKSTALTTFGEILKGYITSWIQTSVIGDSFKALELAKGVAMGTALASAYATAAAFASIMSFGGAAVAGAAGLASTVALAQGLASVPSFATGTDGFVNVPSGYNGDNYPVLLKTGEDFNVRTPSQQRKDRGELTDVVKAIQALNMNLINKDFSIAVTNNAPDIKTTVRKGERVKTKLERQGAIVDER